MRSVLLICYSRTGTSRRLAQLLASQHGWPVGEVLDARPRMGLAGLGRCVLDALLRRAPDVRYFGPAPDAFDAVVLVSPVWLGRLSGPMRGFVAARERPPRAWAAATTSGGGSTDRVHHELQQLLGRPPLVAQAFPARSVDDGSCASRARWFGQAVAEAQEPPQRSAEWSVHTA